MTHQHPTYDNDNVAADNGKSSTKDSAMKHGLSEQELRALASQLACPHGDKANDIADSMASSNLGMTQHAIAHLQLQAGQTILEVGHGGAAHLPWLLAQQPDLHYYGLELSLAMHDRAKQQHTHAHFYHYDGQIFPPFTAPTDDSAHQPTEHPNTVTFDRIFSVNTLYFLPDPVAFLCKLHDIIAVDGIVALTYGSKAFMQTLPFHQYGFQLYDEDDVNRIIAQTPFRRLAHHDATEEVISKVGDKVTRHFVTTVLHAIGSEPDNRYKADERKYYGCRPSELGTVTVVNFADYTNQANNTEHNHG